MESAPEGWGFSRCGILSGRELQLQRRQRLPEAIVNLARDARAFVFANVLLPSRQTAERRPRGAELLLGTLRLRDVPISAERSLLAAKLDADEREQSIARCAVARP